MRRLAAAVLLVVSGLAASAGIGVVLDVVDASPEAQPCEASRVGDVVTVDLSTCEEVTPSTSTSPPTTQPPPSTTAISSSTSSTTPATTSSSTTVAPSTTIATTSTSVAPTTTSTTTAPATTTTTPAGVLFRADFATASDFYDRFRLDVHYRDPAHVDYGRVFPGDHDMACGAPTTQRDVHVSAPSELFWWCDPSVERDGRAGHVMTGMADVDGYTILSFSPNQSFTNVRRICWDVNQTDLGGRKWVQMVVVPEAAFQANGQRLDYISLVTQDVDQTAVRLPAGGFIWQTWDHKIRTYNGQTETLFDGSRFTTNDKARRYRHCVVDNRNGTLTLTQERDGAPRVVTVPGRFPAQVRVIFQDDNYTPEKDGPIAGFTWHFDNILIES